MIILCVLLILAMKIRYPNCFMPSKLYINGLRKISYFDFHECHLALWKNRNGKYWSQGPLSCHYRQGKKFIAIKRSAKPLAEK